MTLHKGTSVGADLRRGHAERAVAACTVASVHITLHKLFVFERKHLRLHVSAVSSVRTPEFMHKHTSGINSTPSRNPELRSFSVEPAPLFQTLACDANGIFTLKLGLGERELVLCPAGCAASTNAHVYGSGKLQHLAEILKLFIF